MEDKSVDGNTSDLCEAEKNFDFVRFTFADIHGIARSKTVCKSSFSSCFRDGTGVIICSIGMGLGGELLPYLDIYKDDPEIRDRNSGNIMLMPVPGTLHPLLTAGAGKYRVGQALCHTVFAWNRATVKESPRNVALRQLERLESLGYHLYASVEIEFILVDKESLVPVFQNGAENFSSRMFTRYEKVLLEVAATLHSMGVEVETLHTEYAHGQFELVLKPQNGIKVADNVFLAKDIIKAVAFNHGFMSVFISMFNRETTSNAAHFNHSLQEVATGHNGFSDVSRKDLLSDTFRHWMGGLIQHFPAHISLCNPTANCYRSLGRPWLPSRSDWGFEDRLSSYRVTTESPRCTYIECRGPSATSNPYIVVAATLASGVDGLTRKIPCPLPRKNIISEAESSGYTQPYPIDVPTNLSEALEAINKDDILVESLGKVFVRWYSNLKRRELELLKKWAESSDIEEGDVDKMLLLERKLYMEFL